MAWLFLILAGIMEWGWPVGLKLTWRDNQLHYLPLLAAVICMGLSSGFLLLAQRTIPIGTAYAVWTGIGTVGTFVLGIIVFGESTELMRFLSAGLIVVGILGLKLSAGE